jgi:polyvinyl alcohol dehydrogenase (cytochrome)
MTGLVALITGLIATPAAQADGGTSWSMAGQNILNTRSNSNETTLNPGNVSNLAPKWTFATHGDVTATPAVVGGAVYFPDWGGYLNKVDATTGALIWQHQISEYDGVAGSVSRTSPAVSNGVVYIGDHSNASLIAVSAATGSLLWITKLDTHPAAQLTQSPVVYNGVVYEGVSSIEEVLAGNPNYPCCTFRGSLNAVNAATGAVLWKTYTVPDNGGTTGGYSGGAIWSGMPAIDPVHNTVYVTTGNNYSVPASVTTCENGGGTPQQCLAPTDHMESMLAMDLTSGAIKWSTGPAQFDQWNFGCLNAPPNNCPSDPGQDLDFGDGAHIFAVPAAGGGLREVVGAGAKSGVYWTVDAQTGQIIWDTAAGPGSYSGGIMWGSSVDCHAVYIAEANQLNASYTLPNGTSTTASSYAALDPATGKILWQVVDPSGGHAIAPLSSANGVVYASSSSGHVYALNAATGAILKDITLPAAANAGITIVNGIVYMGDGYKYVGMSGSLTSGTFYAYSLNGH